MASNNLFPHHPRGLSASFAKSEVEIDGMKVVFDKVAMLLPAELSRKGGDAVPAPLVSGMTKVEGTCTIYLVAKPEFVASLDGWVESNSGYVASIRNYVEDIYQDVNGLWKFKVKQVDDFEIPDFNPLTDTRVYLKRSGGNAAYNFCNANVNVDFHGVNGRQPGTAHSAAYLVAHEALHTYLIRLGVLLFGGAVYLSQDMGGHTNVGANGKAIANLNLEGFQMGDAREQLPKYAHVTDEGLTWKREFQQIHPLHLYFLKEYGDYVNLSHTKFSRPENQKRMTLFRDRQACIREDSQANQWDVDKPTLLLPSVGRAIAESNAHIDFSKDPSTAVFK